MTRSSLRQIHTGHREIPILLAISAIALGFGLFLPVITFKEMVFFKHTFSVVTGIQSLFQDKQYFLAFVIFVFSIVFPLVKLGALAALWFGKFSESQRKFWIGWIGALGKWSMLDVFVVAVTVVIAKLSKAASAHAQPGIYVFAFSIALAIFASLRMERLIRRPL